MARVLVVEDDDVTRLMLESLLDRAGHRVRATASVPEARRVLGGSFTPDVLVTDMFMPGGSGLSLAGALREDPVLRDLPIVFLSGRALPGDVQAARAVSAAYLSKPLSVGDLVAAIDDVLAVAARARGEFVHERLGELGRLDDEQDRALFALLLTTFVEQAPGQLETLRCAATAEDPDAVAAAAHHLGGAAGNLGAGALARGCRDAELRAVDGLLPEPADLAALAAELAATCRVFAGIAAQLADGGAGRVG